MSHTKKVAKNSFFLIFFPVLLNLISIFVTGFIARTLGKADYGKFIFSLTLVMMFSAVTNLGLRAITVREIAEDEGKLPVFLGKILLVRFILSLFAVLSVAITVNLFNYSLETKQLAYLASFIIIFLAIASTFYDVFQAFQRMKYVAFTQFLSGLILTILSVVVMYLKLGLISLVLVYCFGNLLAAIISFIIISRKFCIPIIRFDFAFFIQNIRKGIPFFFPGLVLVFGTKCGIIILSKMVGDASVGIYGAASSLVERLSIIPDGICTAIFPAIASLNKTSQMEAQTLFRKFFLFLLTLGLPIAVGVTILAPNIIKIVYGPGYNSSIVVLRFLIWWLCLNFLTVFLSWTIGAIHKEKKGAIVPFISVPVFLLINFVFIPHLHELGVAVAAITSEIFALSIFIFFIRKYFSYSIISCNTFMKIVLANIFSGMIIYVSKNIISLALIAGIISYMICIVWSGIITIEDFKKIFYIIRRKFTNNNQSESYQVEIK